MLFHIRISAFAAATAHKVAAGIIENIENKLPAFERSARETIVVTSNMHVVTGE